MKFAVPAAAMLASAVALSQPEEQQHGLGAANTRFTAPVDEAIDAALAQQRIVGTVVLIALDGKLVYRRAAGFADRETRRPMREDAIFLLSSVTKPFVSVATMRLVAEGRLALHDPVSHWLPDFHPKMRDGASPPITIEQLLTHTAGLNYSFMEPLDGPYRRAGVSSGLDLPGMTLDENLRRITAAPLSYEPGTSWGYSVGHDVLGAVIEKVTGKPLPTVVQDLVTRPLGLVDTGFAVTDTKRLVKQYADAKPTPTLMAPEQVVLYFGLPVSFAPARIFDPTSYPSGGAGMAGTATDFVRFLEGLRTGDPALVPSSERKAMFTAHVPASAQTQGPGWGFGYGWAILKDPHAAKSPQNIGTIQWGGAYGHNWFIDPTRKLTVVALTNTAFEGMSGQFTTDLRDAVYRALSASRGADAGQQP